MASGLIIKFIWLRKANVFEDVYITTVQNDEFCHFYRVQLEQDDLINRQLQLHPEINNVTAKCQFVLEGMSIIQTSSVQ